MGNALAEIISVYPFIAFRDKEEEDYNPTDEELRTSNLPQVFRSKFAKEQAMTRVTSVYNMGFRSVIEIAKRTGLRPSQACFCAASLGLRLAKSREEKAQQALERAKKFKAEKKPRDSLVSSILYEVIEGKIIGGYKDKWAAQKVADELRTNPQKKARFDDLYSLFSLCHTYLEEGERLPIIEMRRVSGFTDKTLKGILERANLSEVYMLAPDLNGKGERVRRVAKLPLSLEDKVYLSGLSCYVVLRNLSKEEKRERETPPEVNGVKIDCRLLCEVYKAEDLGYSLKETSELFEIPEAIVEFCLQNRKKFSRTITKILKEAHPGEKVDKPYPSN